MLEAHGLTKRYNDVVALDALTLTVAPGEVFCLLGANGAGKTTTINLFLNFIQPSSGTARVNGLDVVAQPLGSLRTSPTPRAPSCWRATTTTIRNCPPETPRRR
jgi:ABC-2 type transport system ATP-binding protein